jgi:peroxiredoxin
MPVDSATVPVGGLAPDFTLTAIDGREVTLSNLRGQRIVLVFLRGFM